MLKKKLNDALLKRRQEIEALSQIEEKERTKGNKNAKLERRKTAAYLPPKKKKKSFEEEWDIHRAYQLLLSEHHKRVKTSNMNKGGKLDIRPQTTHSRKRENKCCNVDGCNYCKAKEMLV